MVKLNYNIMKIGIKLNTYYNYFLIIQYIPNPIKITTTIPNVIQSGDNTHHQDQLITFVSFNTINTINSNSAKFIP